MNDEAKAEYAALQDLAAHLLDYRDDLGKSDVWGRLAVASALVPIAGRMLELERSP